MSTRKVQMRYYRTSETGEIVRFDLKTNQWAELRCDQTTRYSARYVRTQVSPEQAKQLKEIPSREAAHEVDDLNRVNSAARGQALTLEIGRQRASDAVRDLVPNEHVNGGQWPGPFPV